MSESSKKSRLPHAHDSRNDYTDVLRCYIQASTQTYVTHIALVLRTQQILARHSSLAGSARDEDSVFQRWQKAVSFTSWMVSSRSLCRFENLAYLRGTTTYRSSKHLSDDTPSATP